MKSQTTTPEVIIPLKGFENHYSISNYGYVIKHNKYYPDRIMKGSLIGSGYYKISLTSTNNNRVEYLHRLMVENFLHITPDCVNHIDGNRLNNNISNLEPCTQKHNINEAIRLRQKPKMSDKCQKNKPRAVIVYDPIDDITYEVHSMYECAKQLGVKICAIYNACNGLQKTVKGLQIRYANN